MNVVFDLGNVLLRWNPRFLYRQIFGADKAGMEWFLAHVCSPAWILEQDGRTSFAEGVTSLAAIHPAHEHHIRAFDERWHETLPGAIEESVAILEELDERGVPLYAITNFNGAKYRETEARFPFLRRFRDVVVSGETGCLKPDREIFEHFLGNNALAASDCLFIDDNPANVAGAEAIGMAGLRFESPEGLRRHLGEMGLLD